MAILPSNDISIMAVRNTLGYPSTDLGTLCSCDKINKWSRFRPGFWFVNNSQILTYQVPQGGGVTDPRGADANGLTTQYYKLGDFRGYNSNASPCQISGLATEDLWLSSNQAGSTISQSITVDLGEVDWFGKETNYWGKNDIPIYDQIVCVRVSGTTTTVAGYSSISSLEYDSGSNRCRITFDVSVPVPSSSGTTVTNTYKFGLGRANKLYAYFQDIQKVFNVTKIQNPHYIIYASDSGLTNLFSKLSGYKGSATSCKELQLVPSTGTFNSGSTSLSIKTTDTQILMYPTYEYLRVTQLRWQVTGVVECYNSSGALLGSWTYSETVAASGSGAFTFNIPLNVTSKDGYEYKIILNSFGTTAVQSV